MSPNSDNAMARFLFAILKQKNLKDINWEAVANDPVLLQPITNGHAARMRYSRFRNTVSGEGEPSPQKQRNKVEGKARVTKSKAKKSTTTSPIKKEPSQHSGLSHYSPMSAASPYLTDAGDDFNARFLTPCSDDMGQAHHHHATAQHHGLAISPPVETGRSHHPQGNYSPSLDFMQHPSQPYSPSFSAFDDAAIDMHGFHADVTVNHHADCGADWTDRINAQF